MQMNLTVNIPKEDERRYFTVPFSVPEGVERLDITYRYPRTDSLAIREGITGEKTVNTIDLALQMPMQTFVGASGSNRDHIWVSGTSSAPGYRRTLIGAGEWHLIFGAYQVEQQGVRVEVQIDMSMKSLRRFQGDTHMHTTASDGTLNTLELAVLARQHKLDFICLTNHNTCFGNENLPDVEGLTIIPGMEWTHYRGHANLLGAAKPIANPFCVNDAQDARNTLQEGKDAGAMLVINHPFSEPECGWDWGFDLIPFDAVEVWNGPLMTGSNAKCLEWWQAQLRAGKRIPIVGGSDFHRPGLGTLPGLPTTVVYALSREPADLLQALRGGHSYIKLSPDAPDISMTFDGGMMGDIAAVDRPITTSISGLQEGDVVCRYTDEETHEAIMPSHATSYQETWHFGGARTLRYEVKRPLQGMLTVAVSNPIYIGEEWRN